MYARFNRLSKAGFWEKVFELSADGDLRQLLLDSSSVRVNQQGAGGAKKTKRRQPWADPVGGLTTKIHLAADERGRAGRIIVGPGQQSDYRQAAALIEGFKPQAVLADRGYDADWLVEALRRQGVAHVVIPSRSNRKVQRQIDKDLYKERNKIERYFCKLKN